MNTKRTVRSTGFTENDALKAGGGLILTVVIVAAGLGVLLYSEAAKQGASAKYRIAVKRASKQD